MLTAAAAARSTSNPLPAPKNNQPFTEHLFFVRQTTGWSRTGQTKVATSFPPASKRRTLGRSNRPEYHMLATESQTRRQSRIHRQLQTERRASTKLRQVTLGEGIR